MKALILILSLAVIHPGCGDNFEWEKLDKFQDFFSANKIEIAKVINSTLGIIQKTMTSSLDILDDIEKWPMPWENPSWNKTNCAFPFPKKDSLKKQFLMDFRMLEESLIMRIKYIRKSMLEISSTISMLGSIADFKNLSCSISNDDCSVMIDSWIEENLTVLKCKIIKNCQKHVITKRSNTCSSNQFRCRNGKCIDASYVCTGSTKCTDGSDEGPQCSRYCFNGFHCANLKCIDKILLCDGKDDCGDSSDEAGCTIRPKNCSLDSGMFQCKNFNCIPLAEVCDGFDGCGDGTDEGGLCGHGCPGKCEEDFNGVCQTTPLGPVCLNKCPPGFADTASGCLPPPEVLPKTLEELLEEMPRLVGRYISSIYQLNQATFSLLFKASADYSKCYGDNSLNKLIRLTNFNETNYSNYTYNIKND